MKPAMFPLSSFISYKGYNKARILLTACLRCQSFTTSSSSKNIEQDDGCQSANSLNKLGRETFNFLERVKDPTKLDSKYIPMPWKKERAKGYTKTYFRDHVTVKLEAGNGGDGCISMLSAFRKQFAGPDGGDGGNGSHIIFKATYNKNNLSHLASSVRAEHGAPGRNKQRHGADAEHLVIEVPLGTIFKYNDKDVGSLDVENAMYLAAKGGAGGKGNMFFTTAIEQAPLVAESGGQGEKFTYDIELRTMADIGLIGYPNAGKSTLLRAVSRARPKVAPVPFTTRNPHVGVIQYADYFQLAVADIPGLIEGAHLNKGLGHAFLRHVQRCSGLLYVLDTSQPEPWQQLDVLRRELEEYESGLSMRPHAVVANKMDLPEAQANLAELQRRVDLPVIAISAKCGNQVQELISLLRWLTEQNNKRPQYRRPQDWWDDETSAA